MKRSFQALFVFLLLGVVKLPLEQNATAHLRAEKLLTPRVELSLRENLGQMGFAASLGGLRSLVASITYLRACGAWENVQWAAVDSLFQLTTRLQPRYIHYWDEAAWHMAWNASSNYLNNEKLNPALREKLSYEHVQRGRDILLEGLRMNPDDARLWHTLAELYERRDVQPAKAAECYLKVGELTGSLRFRRMAGYQYAKAADLEDRRKGYALLLESYRANVRPPSLINTIKDLEPVLDIPMMQRIPEPRVAPGAVQ